MLLPPELFCKYQDKGAAAK